MNKETTISTSKQATYIKAIGRRREASAQIRLYPMGKRRDLMLQGYLAKKDDNIVVNGKRIAEYFPGNVYKTIYTKPFTVTDSNDTFFVSAKIYGGGIHGQAEAMVLGCARALILFNDEYKPLLKKAGLLTRDGRKKERRKAGYAHKARARKQSPKR